MRMVSRGTSAFALLGAVAVALSGSVAAAQGREAKTPWLGVTLVSSGAAGGVEVDHVVRGSPADHAGLRAGDRLTSVDGARLSGASDVVRRIAEHPAGDSIEVTFARPKETRTVRVTLLARPSSEAMLRMDLVGAAAPEWRGLHMTSGAASTLRLRGRVVVLDFWATWCAPCRASMPRLGFLARRYGAEGLSVVGVTSETEEDVVRFAHSSGVSYPLAVDPAGETTRAYGVSTLPTLVVIDRQGVVRDVSVGFDPAGDGRLEQSVRALLAEGS